MNELKHTIYQITNLLNDMIYIGKHSTTTPYDMKHYWGSSKYLDKAIKKYGKKNFKRETLFVFDTEDEVFQKEREVVDESFVARKDTYNIQVGGRGSEGGENHPMFGRKGVKSPNYGKHLSEETKKKISNALKGENHFNYGKQLPKEHCKKIGNAQRGDKNHRYGKPISGEHRESISLSPETIERRRKDVKNESKVWGWQSKLGRKWGIAHAAVDYFINKYASDIKIEISPIVKQRRKDIEDISQEFGYKAELSRLWGISNAAVNKFINKFAQDLITGIDSLVEQRLLDIENEPKVRGWTIRLSEKWNLSSGGVCLFIKKYAPNLII